MERGFKIEKILQSIIGLPSAEVRQAAYELMMARYAGLLALESGNGTERSNSMIDSIVQTVKDTLQNSSTLVHELSGEELAMTVGGTDEDDKEDSPDCFFTPTGNTKIEYSHLWHECASKCHKSLFCYCHNKSNCINRWHRMDEHEELYNQNESNHCGKQKKYSVILKRSTNKTK